MILVMYAMWGIVEQSSVKTLAILAMLYQGITSLAIKQNKRELLTQEGKFISKKKSLYKGYL